MGTEAEGGAGAPSTALHWISCGRALPMVARAPRTRNDFILEGQLLKGQPGKEWKNLEESGRA
jgi:hypothetical protein